ncbi:MAG TPA: hypothetical protein PLV58_04555 [Campylobacterales bacterium]|nr:hypothetical protein [Campylobacterales bacterium]
MLDIDPNLLAFEIVTFLALVAILNTVLYKPLLGFMEERNSNLKADVGLAGSQESEREALNAEATALIAEAKNEGSKIRHEAVAKAKAEAAIKINAAKDSVEVKISNFSGELIAQKAELKATIIANQESYKQSLAKALKI